jgi:hypothetical protein
LNTDAAASPDLNTGGAQPAVPPLPPLPPSPVDGSESISDDARESSLVHLLGYDSRFGHHFVSPEVASGDPSRPASPVRLPQGVFTFAGSVPRAARAHSFSSFPNFSPRGLARDVNDGGGIGASRVDVGIVLPWVGGCDGAFGNRVTRIGCNRRFAKDPHWDGRYVPHSSRGGEYAEMYEGFSLDSVFWHLIVMSGVLEEAMMGRQNDSADCASRVLVSEEWSLYDRVVALEVKLSLRDDQGVGVRRLRGKIWVFLGIVRSLARRIQIVLSSLVLCRI